MEEHALRQRGRRTSRLLARTPNKQATDALCVGEVADPYQHVSYALAALIISSSLTFAYRLWKDRSVLSVKKLAINSKRARVKRSALYGRQWLRP